MLKILRTWPVHYNTLLNANHSQIQSGKTAIIESAESLEILQKIRQIALWDVAIMDKVRKKGGKKARQFKVAELQRSKMHIVVVVGYIRELHV